MMRLPTQSQLRSQVDMVEQVNAQTLPNPHEFFIPSLKSATDTNSGQTTDTRSNIAPMPETSLDRAFALKQVNDASGNTLDFSPTYLNGEVKISAPASMDGALPGFGISQGTDVFLPDVHFSVSDKPPGSPTVAPDALPQANSRIALAAERNSGTKPWMDTKYAPQVQNGRLAGAAAVSMVLQDLGYNYADSANVGTLTKQLQQNGWSMVPLGQAKPGDIVFGGKTGTDWRAGGGNAHVGIIGKDGKLWHNSSANGGNWQEDSLASSFPAEKFGNQVWVLRPPQSNVPDKSVPNQPVRPNRPDRPDQPSPYRPRPDLRPDNPVRPGDDQIRPEDQPRDRTEKEALILNSAKRSVDRRLWAQSPFANSVKGGRLGCAASVSEVLKMSGFNYANSAGVGGLVDQLKQHGWTAVPLNQARPGDVVYGGKPGTRWWEGGGNAHVGVVGEGGQVYHNSSGARRWVQDQLTRVFNTNRFGDQRFVLRPPQGA